MCNTCLFASFTVIFYVFIGVTKFRYVTLKTPWEMTREEYERLSAKNNWMPEVKLRTSSILDDSNSPVTLVHFVLCVVHSVKVYGHYGEVTKHYETACKVINYGLSTNKVVVSNQKVRGQHLQHAQKDMLQDWLETLSDGFPGDGSDRHYQGDGIATDQIALDGADSGVPPHAFTDGAEVTADQLYNRMLSEVKTQKEVGLHRVSTTDQTKQRIEANLLNNINCIMSGECLLFSANLLLSPLFISPFYLCIILDRFALHCTSCQC